MVVTFFFRPVWRVRAITIYQEERRYLSLAVSDNGQLAFVSDLTPETETRSDLTLYWSNINDKTPIEIMDSDNYRGDAPSWSPAGRYLMYVDYIRYGENGIIKVFDTQTGQTRQLATELASVESVEPLQGFDSSLGLNAILFK